MANIDVTTVSIEAATYLLGLNAILDVVRVDNTVPLMPKSGGTFTGVVVLNADPVNPLEAVTKQYADTLAQGLSPKTSVRVATTANISLSGAQTIDGVSIVAGNRVLVKNQTTQSNNGIYVAAAGAWARSADADTWDELISAYTFISEGTVNGDSAYYCTVDAGGTLGVTNVTWVQFGSLAGYAPLASPAFTGVPTAPTAATSTNTTQLATTAFVQAEFAAKEATANEVRAGTATVKTVTPKNAADAVVPVKNNRTGSYGIDWSTGINFEETLTGNITFGEGTNLVEGKSGWIRFIQDATGGRTLTQNANIRTPGGTDLVLSTAANAIDRCGYVIVSVGGNLRVELTALEKDLKA